MLIPLGTDRPLRRPTTVTIVLIAINVVVAFVQVLMRDWADPTGVPPSLAWPWITEHFGLWPDRAWTEPWQFFTSMFMHAGPWHFMFNMIFLWVFGPNVEDKFGRWWYLAFYLGGGVVAGIVHVVTSEPSGLAGYEYFVPAVGASGAIAAVSGAYLILFPLTRVRVLLVFFLIGVWQIRAVWFICFFIAIDLYRASVGSEGIAVMAHLGGYASGIVAALLVLWLRLRERETYDVFMIGKQAYRRRQIKSAAYDQQREMERRLDPTSRPPKNSDPEEAIEFRADVVRLIGEGDLDGAARQYKRLVDAYADTPRLVTLSRNHQHTLGAHLFAMGDHSSAAFAYERFLEANPSDREAPSARLLLALISARYLNDPVRASGLLMGLEDELADDAEREMARELRSELG